MADETKPAPSAPGTKPAPSAPGTIKVKVKGPGSIHYGSSQEAKAGTEALLTAQEYESVKHLVTKI